MTKLRALTSITAVLAFAAALAGCPMDNDEGIIPAPLPAPQASLYGSLLSWPAVPGAGGYTVHAGDLRENIPAAGAGARQTDLAGLGLPVGEHSVAVVALGVEGRSLDSPPSDPITFTVNCPDCGNYPCGCGDYPQPIEVEHYSTTIAGIDFGTSGYIGDKLTAEQSKALQARIDAIRDQFAALDADALAGFTPYIYSLTVSIHPIEGGRIVGLNEEKKAVIYTDSTGLDGIMADLAYGRDLARAEREAAEEAAYWAAIEPNATNIDNAGINFHVAGNLLTRAQIRDLRAMVKGMNLAAFIEYVTGVEFARNVPGGLEIGLGTGEDAMGSIRIETNEDLAALESAVNTALDTARAQVIGERDRARAYREAAEREEAERLAAEREAAFRAANPIVEGPQNVDGIIFALEGAAGFDTRDEADKDIIAGITAAIAGQGIQGFDGWGEFAGYITNVTFANVATPTRQLVGAGANTTATIVVPHGFTANELLTFLEQTQSQVESRREAVTSPDLRFVFERPDPGGMNPHLLIRTYVEEGAAFTDEEIIAMINGISNTQYNGMRENISIVNFMIDVPDAFEADATAAGAPGFTFSTDRGMRVRIGADGRGIVYLDLTANTNGVNWTFLQSLQRARMWVLTELAAQQAQTQSQQLSQAIVAMSADRDSR